MAPSDPVVARLRRRTPILVCRKCLKRAPQGGALRKALKAALKQRRDDDSKRKPRLVMASCFGLCPKRAVVVASAATLARGECLLLAKEGDAEKAAAVLVPAEMS